MMPYDHRWRTVCERVKDYQSTRLVDTFSRSVFSCCRHVPSPDDLANYHVVSDSIRADSTIWNRVNQIDLFYCRRPAAVRTLLNPVDSQGPQGWRVGIEAVILR